MDKEINKWINHTEFGINSDQSIPNKHGNKVPWVKTKINIEIKSDKHARD